MGRYAENTSVSVEKSKAEIEKTLMRYGADNFSSMTSRNPPMAAVVFEMHRRRVKFVLILPQVEEFRYTDAKRRERSDTDTLNHWEQACRQRWRALNLCIKAKLEAVECGITTFEDEFLAHIVLPNKQTISEMVLPKLAEMCDTGKMLPLLEAPVEKN